MSRKDVLKAFYKIKSFKKIRGYYLKSRNIDKLHAQIATSVKQRIRILRENNNYSQREIAEYLGIDRSTYACYELGKTSPSVEVLVALSELYLVSCEFLLGIKPNEKCNSIEKRILHVINAL